MERPATFGIQAMQSMRHNQAMQEPVHNTRESAGSHSGDEPSTPEAIIIDESIDGSADTDEDANHTSDIENGNGAEHAALLRIYHAEQREVRYPDLTQSGADLAGVTDQRAARPLLYRLRPGVGLVTIAWRHGALTLRQRAALGVFRLQQFALCGWYNLGLIVRQGLLVDPTLAECPDDTIHIVVGSAADDRVLAYFCLHAPPPPPPGGRHLLPWRRQRPPRMDTRQRPLFPTEYDQCGPDVFASLPWLAALPLHRVFEMASLLSNRAVSSPLSFAALLEAFYTVSCLVREPLIGIDALIGHVDAEARRLVYRMGVPVLYAPLAPPDPVGQDELWSKDTLEPGKFWPFVIATQDLYRHAGWFARLDRALDSGGHAVRNALVRLLREPAPTRPQAFAPLASSRRDRYFWTDDPLFHQEVTPRQDMSTPQSMD